MLDVKPGPRGQPRKVTGLAGCAEAIVLSRLSKRRRVLVLADDPAQALRISDQLRSLMDPSEVNHIVGWEVLPYDKTSPPKAIASDRIAAMARLRTGKRGVYVTSAADALFPCMPTSELDMGAFQLAAGDSLDLDKLTSRLAKAGSAKVDRVRAAGEFAVYGGQMDIYPGGQLRPFRIVMDESRIEQIRSFDPATQLSTGKLDRIDILPSREYPLDDKGILYFRGRWRERFDADLNDDVYRSVTLGNETEGAEFFLPLFYKKHASLFDYLGYNDLVWFHSTIKRRVDSFFALAKERHKKAKKNKEAALDPDEIFLSYDGLTKAIERHQAIELCDQKTAGAEDIGAAKLPPLGVRRDSTRPYELLEKWLSGKKGRIVFSWSGQARKSQVVSALKIAGLKASETDGLYGRKHGVFLYEGALTGGFYSPVFSFAVITEAELYDYVPPPRLVRSAAVAAAELDDLSPGDLVVHKEHGVARYLGLSSLDSNGSEDEYIHLEFDNEIKLYVAVEQCHLVSHYKKPEVGEEIKLHAIGSKRWKKTRAKAQKVAHDTAAQLLGLYAKRKMKRKLERHSLDEDAFATFCAGFEYSDTADQLKATAQVAADLCGPRPMDRLICGDVGYGKTEIAMRAAWVSWSRGEQVAMVAPTTLLADQLHRNFIDRFRRELAQWC